MKIGSEIKTYWRTFFWWIGFVKIKSNKQVLNKVNRFCGHLKRNIIIRIGKR